MVAGLTETLSLPAARGAVTVHVFDSPASASAYIAGDIATHLRDAIVQKGRALWVGCGGTTPKPIYQRLVEAGLDWDKIRLFQVDERFVPTDDAASNTRMMREALEPVLSDSGKSGMELVSLIQDIVHQVVPLGLADAIGPVFQGAGYYMADNPPFGAVFTYYMKSGLKSRREVRQAAEKELAKKGADVFYPPWDSLKAEDREENPAIVVTITDANGKPIRRFTAPSSSGINRVAWDLKLQPPNPVTGPPYTPDPDWPFGDIPLSPYVVPGTYQVSFEKRVNGVFTPIGETQRFQVVGIDGPGTRTMATMADQQRTADLERSVLGLNQVISETLTRMTLFKRAIDETAAADTSLQRRVRVVTDRLKDAQEALGGDPTMASRNEATPPSLLGRLGGAIGSNWGSTLEAPTPTQIAEFELVRAKFDAILSQVRQLINVDLKGLEQAAEDAGVPWTSGRFPKPPG